MNFTSCVVHGGIFFTFGLKWAINFTNNPSYPPKPKYTSWTSGTRNNKRNPDGHFGFSKNWPFDGLLKLIVAVLGFVLSIIVAYSSQNSHFIVHILNGTTYLFFAISGVVDILLYYCPIGAPTSIDKFLLSLAFGMEGLMIYLSLNQKSFMEQHVYFLLILTIFACAIATLSEAVLTLQGLARFARALFMMIQGTWWIQTGYILYNPSGSLPSSWLSATDYNIAVMQISFTFAVHTTVSVILILMISFTRKGMSRLSCRNSTESTESSSPDSSNQCPFCSSEDGSV